MTTSIEQTASDASGFIEAIPALLEAQRPDPSASRRALSALRPLMDSGLTEHHGTELRPLTDRVQGALSVARVGARGEAVGRYVKTTKVHGSVLRALAKGPATPSVIAQRSSRAPAVISRALKRLRSEGLVAAETDQDDKRQLIYELTDAGEALAGEIVAFTDEPASEKFVDREVVAAALREALDAAVTLRRRTSERRDVLRRLRAIAEHARRASTPDVRVRALNEVLTTLRQDGQVEAFEPELKALELIATGEDETIPARYALRAVAHLEYQLGRHPTAHSASRQATWSQPTITSDDLPTTLAMATGETAKGGRTLPWPTTTASSQRSCRRLTARKRHSPSFATLTTRTGWHAATSCWASACGSWGALIRPSRSCSKRES